jgi:hypothetical protein
VLASLILAVAAAVATAQPAAPAAAEITFLDDPMEGDCALAGDLTLHPGDKVRFVANYQNDGSCYLLQLDPPSACFYKVTSAATVPIGARGELRNAASGTAQRFVITRHNCRLAFVYQGMVVCRGWDDALANGKAGYAVSGAVIGDPFLQPIGQISANDDFVRQEDTRHMWAELSGTWDIQKLRDDDQADEMEADKSANAFVYHVVSNGPALSLAEKDIWFWDNYHVSASARSMGRGAMGLVVLAQDDKNCLLFRWASSWARDAQGNRAALVEVADGQPKVLAEKPGGFIPDRWYDLDTAICDGDIVCSIDGQPILRGHSDRFGLGSPGVYSEGPEGSYFDDLAIEDYESFQEDFGDLTRWRVAQGDWSSTGRAAKCAASGLLTSGRAEWTDYLCACDISADRGAVGLEIARQGDGQALLFRLGLPGSSHPGKAQFVKVGPSGEQLLSEATVRFAPGKPHRVGVSIRYGSLQGYVDGQPVLEAVDAESKGGSIALYANQAGGAQFAQLGISFLKPRKPAHVMREFTKTSEHFEMAEWASPRAPWIQPPTVEPGATWWTKGDYFGDAAVTFTLRFVGLRDGAVRVTLNGTPEDEKVGIHLLLAATKNSRTLKGQVLDGTSPIGEGLVELPDSNCQVEFSRKGNSVVVMIDGKPLITTDLRAR